KDLRGHYYETALAVAEAARDQGLQPVLAAHVSCPAELAPGWLPFFPVFRTDHWMPPRLPRAAWWLRQLVPPSWQEPLRAVLRWPAKGFARLRHFLRLPLRPFRGWKSASETGNLKLALERVAAGQEFDHLRLFQADLQQFLYANGCRACDHVFLP